MRLGFVRAVAACVMCLAACSAAPAQEGSVRLYGASATIDAYHGFLFLGNPLGFYKDQGVNVDFGTAGGSAATLQLMASGQVDMGYIGMDVLILAKKRNPDLPVVAVYLQDRGNIYEIVVPADSDIKTVRDLDGKNIGVANLASGAVPNLKGMLTDAGLNADTSVGLVPVGNGAQAAAALRAGRVKALSLFRAQHALIETLGFEFRYFTREAPSAIIAVNTNFLKKNRDKVIKVLRGIAMGSTFAEANPEAAVREFWKLYGMPQGLSEQEAMARAKHVLSATSKLWKDYKDQSVKWGDLGEAQWKAMQDFLVAQKLLSEPVPSDTLFTADLINEVNQIDLTPAIKAAESYK